MHEQRIADRGEAELRLVSAGHGFERLGILEQLEDVLIDRVGIEGAVPPEDRFERGRPLRPV